MRVVVLCGGVGCRLWPASSKDIPKQFMRMDDGLSFMQKTLLRAYAIPGIEEIIIVTNKKFTSKINEELKKLCDIVDSQVPIHFICEPFGKNTAASIASAALYISRSHSPNDIMLVLPTDHLINNQDGFVGSVIEAEKIAKTSKIVTFGVSPKTAETGYGYIEASGQKVLRFIEKPSKEKAKEYIKNKDFFWNSGMFCFSAERILIEMKKHCSDILQSVQSCMKVSSLYKKSGNSYQNLDAEIFQNVPENSIDYAVMEKSNQVSIVACDIDWRDVGNWESMSNLTIPDSDGNRIKGNAMLHDSKDCYIENNGKIIAAVGVKNLAIINTRDGLLITNKSHSNDVKAIYTKLQVNTGNQQGEIRCPWGEISIITNANGIKISSITISPNMMFEVNDYFHRSSNWMVVSGEAIFLEKKRNQKLSMNMSKYITLDNKIRIANWSTQPLRIIVTELDDFLINDIILSKTNRIAT